LEFKQKKNIDNLFSAGVMRIETENYIIRGTRSGDWEDMIEIYQNKYLHKYSKVQYILTEKMAINLMTNINYNFTLREAITWIIERKIDGEKLGIISLSNISHTDKKAEIGYAVKQSAMKKGVMGECLEKVIDILLELGFVRLEANVYRKNIASIKLCQKIGFENEGLRKKYLFNQDTNTYLDSYIFAVVDIKKVKVKRKVNK
jgi:ribosomal-protein-alanine N-acetyltransferase